MYEYLVIKQTESTKKWYLNNVELQRSQDLMMCKNGLELFGTLLVIGDNPGRLEFGTVLKKNEHGIRILVDPETDTFRTK
jgi:hypothetical protein